MNTDQRKKELLDLVNNDAKFVKLIDDLVYLETELERLRKLPKLKINPNNLDQQKKTQAAILYKDYFQQYLNGLRTLIKATGTDEDDDDSPFRAWLKDHLN